MCLAGIVRGLECVQNIWTHICSVYIFGAIIMVIINQNFTRDLIGQSNSSKLLYTFKLVFAVSSYELHHVFSWKHSNIVLFLFMAHWNNSPSEKTVNYFPFHKLFRNNLSPKRYSCNDQFKLKSGRLHFKSWKFREFLLTLLHFHCVSKFLNLIRSIQIRQITAIRARQALCFGMSPCEAESRLDIFTSSLNTSLWSYVCSYVVRRKVVTSPSWSTKNVKCFSEELCHLMPTKNALMLFKVDFRGEDKSFQRFCGRHVCRSSSGRTSILGLEIVEEKGLSWHLCQ